MSISINGKKEISIIKKTFNLKLLNSFNDNYIKSITEHKS